MLAEAFRDLEAMRRLLLWNFNLSRREDNAWDRPADY